MKIKVSEATTLQIDWLVTSIEAPDALRFGVKDWRDQRRCAVDSMRCFLYRWGSNWSQGGPIIDREKIDLSHIRHGDLSVTWDASADSWENEESGDTPLIAAMRCFIASKLGDEVEVPDDLS
jgi:hypothetical protein